LGPFGAHNSDDSLIALVNPASESSILLRCSEKTGSMLGISDAKGDVHLAAGIEKDGKPFYWKKDGD
jgi:hypothetical protein